MPDLLGNLLSRDPHRIWAGACAVIRLHDDPALDGLAAHLAQTERQTAGVELGGALFPNSEHLQQALRVLRLRVDGGCPCHLYPSSLLYSPEKEAQAGRIHILCATEPPDWNMTSRCRCQNCGIEYDVEGGESHYSWWQWQPV